jgi:3-methylcrotonyl-CoA carboxylase beta subunit
MCDEAIIVKGTGSLYLGGPPLVQAATGEIIGSEELGGADVHCGISGCTDHYAEDERSAMNIARHVVESLNMETQIISTRIEPREPLYHDRSMEDMARLIPADDHDSIIGDWPMMDILARIFDGSEFHHFKEKFGCNLICGFTRLNGYLVGVVANDGLLDTTASIKGSHFIRICDGRNIPIIFFQNTLSDDEFLSPTGNGGTTAKARSAMMATLSCTQVPKLTIVMGGSYGPTSYAMCGRCMSPNFMFSWPNARIGIASSHHIMDYIKGQDESPHEDDYFVLLKERFDQIAASHSSHLIDDGTILPHETRHVRSSLMLMATATSHNYNTTEPLYCGHLLSRSFLHQR